LKTQKAQCPARPCSAKGRRAFFCAPKGGAAKPARALNVF